MTPAQAKVRAIKICELTGCGAYSRRDPVKTAQSARCKHPPCKEPEYCGYAAYCGATDILSND